MGGWKDMRWNNCSPKKASQTKYCQYFCIKKLVLLKRLSFWDGNILAVLAVISSNKNTAMHHFTENLLHKLVRKKESPVPVSISLFPSRVTGSNLQTIGWMCAPALEVPTSNMESGTGIVPWREVLTSARFPSVLPRPRSFRIFLSFPSVSFIFFPLVRPTATRSRRGGWALNG